MDIEQLRQYCLSFPAATEDIKWDHDLVFSVGAKMFCVIALEPPFTCSFKVSDEIFEEMSQQQGFRPAPYMARAKWVQVTNLQIVKYSELQSLIKQSYDLIKQKLTKKMRTELGL